MYCDIICIDAEKLISITSKEDKTVRTKIVPDYEQFDKGKDLWSWWQEKNMADTIMKSAIGSAEVIYKRTICYLSYNANEFINKTTVTRIELSL